MTVTARDEAPPEPRPSTAAVRRLWPRRIPGRIYVMTVAALLAVAGLYAVTDNALGNARDGLRVVGQDAGPTALAAGDLYFALSDMDGQVANILLIGREERLGVGRQTSKDLYTQRRAEATRAALQAAELTRGDPAQEQTVRALLDGMGLYDRLSAEAMTLDERSGHRAGETPPKVRELYGAATDLMRKKLLPAAYNLTLDSGAVVRQTYEAKRSAAATGALWVGLTGAFVLALLLIMQGFLTRWFRRRINPALALATLVAFIMVTAGIGALFSSTGSLREAKEDGFDSVLALSRARALSNNADWDQLRVLLDPERRDVYEQAYLEKSQNVLYTPAGDNLAGYGRGVTQAKLSVRGIVGDAPLAGILGEEAADVTLDGQRNGLAAVLKTYQEVQRNDGLIRKRAATDQRSAIESRMESGDAYRAYDRSLSSLSLTHQRAYEDAVRAGNDALAGWSLLLPGAILLIAAGVLVGVRPRLAEYR